MFIVSHGAERRYVSLQAAVTGAGLVQLLANLWAQVWPMTHLIFGPYQVDPGPKKTENHSSPHCHRYRDTKKDIS